MNIIKEHWEEIKENIRHEYEVTEIAYNIWLKPLEYGDCKDHTITVLIPGQNPEMVSYIRKNYCKYFQSTLSDLMNGEQYSFEFVLKNEETESANDHSSREGSDEKKPVSSYDNANNSNLNKKYRFENFVMGPNNQLALSAALHVAEQPGVDFNPLWIYGGSGLGKTHLMTAIGHYIVEHTDLRVLYVTSEEFTNELVNSIRNGNAATMSDLRDKYRSIDVLLIDDIQFVIGKTQTQEEFFHTFNTLRDNGKAVIITSDKHPSHMKDLDERFRTRFNSGLVADIQPPVYETRVAILQKYAENFDYKVPKEIIDFIAGSIKSNVRELEGAYNKVYAEGSLKNNVEQALTLDDAKNILKEYISMENPTMVTPQLILEAISDYFHIDPEDIISKKRNAEIVLPRQIFMYLCRQMTDITLQGIAGLLYKKDHSTIVHGINKITDEISVNNELKESIEAIKNKIMSA